MAFVCIAACLHAEMCRKSLQERAGEIHQDCMSRCRGKVKVQPAQVTKRQCSRAHSLDRTLNPYLAISLFFHNPHLRDFIKVIHSELIDVRIHCALLLYLWQLSIQGSLVTYLITVQSLDLPTSVLWDGLVSQEAQVVTQLTSALVSVYVRAQTCDHLGKSMVITHPTSNEK